MKAYQVFSGGLDKHGREYQELVATYIDKQRAFDHAEKIANETPLYGDILEFDVFYGDGKHASCTVFTINSNSTGWERVTIARWEEIEVIE